MDADEDKVLRYDPTKYIDPCGRKWKIRPSEFYPGLCEIYCEKKQVKTPDSIEGHWTGRARAEQALANFIRIEWDKAERGSRRR